MYILYYIILYYIILHYITLHIYYITLHYIILYIIYYIIYMYIYTHYSDMMHGFLLELRQRLDQAAICADSDGAEAGTRCKNCVGKNHMAMITTMI